MHVVMPALLGLVTFPDGGQLTGWFGPLHFAGVLISCPCARFACCATQHILLGQLGCDAAGCSHVESACYTTLSEQVRLLCN